MKFSEKLLLFKLLGSIIFLLERLIEAIITDKEKLQKIKDRNKFTKKELADQLNEYYRNERKELDNEK